MTSKPTRQPFRLEGLAFGEWRLQSTFATREAAVNWLRDRPTRIIDTRTGQDVTVEPTDDAEARVLAAEVASRKTNIEWTDATWNPVTGCTRVSPGCTNCYIDWAPPFRIEGRHFTVPCEHCGGTGFEPMTGRFRDSHACSICKGEGEVRSHAIGSTTGVRLHPERLDQPLRWKKPRKVFVNSLSDLFHVDVPDEYIARVWAVMALAPQHTFQVLTKRHGRMKVLLNSDTFQRQVGDAIRGFVATGKPDRAWYASWPLPNVWVAPELDNPHHSRRQEETT